MKLLKDILYQAGLLEVAGSTNVAIEHVAFDSRNVRPFTLFVAVPGTQVDGHKFIDQAISKGAVAIVCEEFPELIQKGITYVKVGNSSVALAEIAANFYNHPSSQLKLVAVTGTNGKTTTVSLLFDLFRLLGHRCGKLSTVEVRINNEKLPATHTTPDALQIQQLLRQMVDKGCEYCFMEASSHAIDQNRMMGLALEGAVFTNITHDHLDYHKTFDAYIAAKKKLFDGLPVSAFALYNRDDRHGDTMVQNCKGQRRSFALQSMADFKGKVLENTYSGLHLSIDGSDVYTRLIGAFNAYNILAVYGTAVLLGKSKEEVLTVISSLKPAVGRFQHVKTPGGITAIVDYAHTPDALENVLRTIQEIQTGDGQVITVVGCGGDRDKTKRPEMAKIAARFSNKVILTSDNPRSEEPGVIINDMKAGLDSEGLKKSLAIEDRKEAIKLAISSANSGDVVLVAGKGHETYQEIKGQRYPFDDMQIVNENLKMFEK